MGKKVLSLCMALVLCLSLLPATALAEGTAPQTLYVGDCQITNGSAITYLKAGSTAGSLVAGSENDWTVKYEPNTATLTLNGATIQGGTSTGSVPYGAGIYAQCSNGQSVTLTIKLIGENTITGYYGIYVNAEISADSNGTDASLTITGENNGSLEVSGSNHGIFVKSGTGNASLNIEKATVTSNTNNSYAAGVYVMSSISANLPTLSLAVNGGSLTASGGTSGDGIQFVVGSFQATGATTNLTVTDNAIVDAKNGGISAKQISNPINTDISATGSSGGIVFDGNTGTVYGAVTLQEDLTIGEGESLTIGDGASLTTDGKLTVNGGTLNGTPNGDVTYKVTGVSLNKDSLTLDVGARDTLTATITPDNATNKNVTWSSNNESVATVENGKVTATGEGTATITVTTEDGDKTATCTVTVTASPEPEPEPTPPPYIPPTYAVTTPETPGGTVTVSPSRASSGRTVTITAAPDTGFALESLTVLDSRGNEIALTDKGGGKYTFTMPASRVTVEASFTPAPLPFEDVAPGAWYESAVRYAYFHNIMEGMRETEFAPATALTRAMAVQILYNLEGQPDLSDENLGYPYEDVDAQAWYGDAVYWARITGVATGYGDGTFQPGDSITRQEFAQMLYNYAKYKGYDLSAEGDLSQFPDSESVADWAEAAMRWANGNQLINGHDDGTIDAAGIGTRAQAASILMKFDQNLVEN